jgi:predicted nucleic acid-binding Zn ribbon protein
MEHNCNNCGKVTEGFKITINGVSDFMCLTCKTPTPLVEEPKQTSCGVIYKCQGFHNTDYRSK